MTPALASRSHYKWLLVGMLWFVCFFNYADRQAIFSLFPLLRRALGLSELQLGIVGSAFMWMYALAGPAAGWLCDRLPRKTLVLGGLIFWSIVTAATALAHSYAQLTTFRALGGLGEAFYFPASMSLIADYHGPRTRSRAMSIHQSSVYAGSIAGGALSGLIGQTYGWRPSFLVFGGSGVALGCVLWAFIVEPRRGQSEPAENEAVLESGADALALEVTLLTTGARFFSGVRDVLRRPAVLVLILVFVGANFVAVVFLTWMPSFLYTKFHMSLAMAGFNGTVYLQIASVLGVLAGGWVADTLVARNPRRPRSGRILAQSLGLLCGVPFLVLTGFTSVVAVLLAALVGFGFFKGLYDANIWASLYDVIPLRRRGVAVGLMNSLGWLGGGAAPIAIALAAEHFGMSRAISATSIVYLAIGLALLWTAQSNRILPPSSTYLPVRSAVLQEEAGGTEVAKDRERRGMSAMLRR